jgi:hypothetical protein
MSKINVNTVEPEGATTTLVLGASGDTISIPSGVTIANSGTATGFGGDNTPAFAATRDTDQSISDDTVTKVQMNTEVFDTDSAYDPTTNYRFTVPSGEGGKYYVYADVTFHSSHSDTDMKSLEVLVKKNGSTAINAEHKPQESYGGQTETIYCQGILVLSAADYLEVYGYFDNNQGSSYTNFKSASFGAYKLIGV